MKALSRIASSLSRSGAVRNQRRAVATRDASLTAGGSGALSRRGRLTVLVLAIAALALLAFAPLAQSKEVIRYFGNEFGNSSDSFGVGPLGGNFENPRDIAVNRSGVGAPLGTTYVADEGNHRIQRFDKNGKFVSAWGKDVIASTINERQRLLVDATGGAYSLTFNGVTTAPIAYNAQNFNVGSALAALSSVGGGANVVVSGGPAFGGNNPLYVTFQGALAAANQPQLTVDTSQLEGTAKISTLADGAATVANNTGTAFEVCTVATECKAGVSSGGDGTTAGNGTLASPQSVAVDSDTGNVYVSDRNNRRIDVYDGSGTFIRAYGWNVVASGADNGAEFQTVTVDATGGEFKLSFGATAPTETNPIPYNASAATVQTELAALGDVGAGNIAVSGPAGGPWVVRFIGTLGNVNQPNLGSDGTLLTGDNPAIAGTGPALAVAETVAGGGSTYEICRAVDVCQAGSSGAGAGQYGSGTTAGTFGITTSQPDSNASTGTIYLADSGNRRVDTYSLDGTSFGSLGSSANFGSTQPRKVVVDSRGIVYASDSNNGGEVDRFDTQNANGGGVNSLLTSLPASINEVQEPTFSNFENFGDVYRLTCPNGVQTGDIKVFANSSGIQALDEALTAACGAGNFSVSGGSTFTATVTFQGALGSKDLAPMSCLVVSSVQPIASCSVNTVTQGKATALLAGSTFGLAVDPDSDLGGPEKDTLYALRGSSVQKDSAAVQQFGPVNDPGLTAAPTIADAVHGSAAGLSATAVNGLGVDDKSGRLFVSATATTTGGGGAHRVYVIGDPLPAPAVNLNPVTVKTDTTATFSATIDPKGGTIKCTFQYSTDFKFTTTTDVAAPGCNFLNPDGGFQALSQKATGLTPNTHYFVRLKTASAFNPSATSTSGSVAFDTNSVPPVVSDVGAIEVQDTSARLVGTIDPRNSAAGYVFQYGTTPGLGSSTPPLNIGGGTAPITVSQVIGGLAKDTPYWFRLVATNGFGTTNGTTQTFHTRAVPFPPADAGNCTNAGLRAEQGSTYLQSCRAYEMVSPPDKNQGGVDQQTDQNFGMALARDGEAATFCTSALFGEPPAQETSTCGPQLSTRTASGWQTSSPFPPHCYSDNNGFIGQRKVLLNPDFDRAGISLPESSFCSIQPISPSAPDQAFNVYRMDLTSDPFQFDLANTATVEPFTIGTTMIGGSDDFSHLVYLSKANQTPDSPPPGEFDKIYDWEELGHGDCTVASPSTVDGCLSLVTRDTPANGGGPFTTGSGFPKSDGGAGSGARYGSAISADGERIFFYHGQRLYMREGGTTTFDLSIPECAVPADCVPNGAAENFIWATEAGDVALFTSADKLTDASSASGVKLYRWDRAKPEGSRLTDLTVALANADGTGPAVQDFIGASDDGSVVYLVNGGFWRVAWNGGSPTAERLGSFASYAAGTWNVNETEHLERVSAAGDAVSITTRTALDPAADRDSDADIYRWGVGEGWTCVSCQLPGTPSAGDVETDLASCCDTLAFYYAVAVFGERRQLISDDGKRVFFVTRDALVPQDTNGEVSCPLVKESIGGRSYACQDVYEWNDGTRSLISSGQGSAGATLVGADGDGEDVAFTTRERLVGWDVDNATDIYDARAGGGFPEPPPVPPACDLEAGACEGPVTVAPATTGAGTAVFEGPGNQEKQVSEPCKRGFVKRKGKCVKRHKRNKRAHHRAANHNRRASR